MSRVAYLDLVGGVAGDMLLAALLDAGAGAAEVLGRLRRLPLAHRAARLETVVRGGIRARLLAGTPSTAGTTRSLDEIERILAAAELPEPCPHHAALVFERLAAAEARAHGQAAAERAPPRGRRRRRDLRRGRRRARPREPR